MELGICDYSAPRGEGRREDIPFSINAAYALVNKRIFIKIQILEKGTGKLGNRFERAT
jgi:hypothetical protein